MDFKEFMIHEGVFAASVDIWLIWPDYVYLLLFI